MTKVLIGFRIRPFPSLLAVFAPLWNGPLGRHNRKRNWGLLSEYPPRPAGPANISLSFAVVQKCNPGSSYPCVANPDIKYTWRRPESLLLFLAFECAISLGNYGLQSARRCQISAQRGDLFKRRRAGAEWGRFETKKRDGVFSSSFPFKVFPK